MACFTASCNTLGSVWYAFGVVALQVYLLYLAALRYQLYNDVAWRSTPTVWLQVYAILYALCIPLTFLLFAFAVFKSGNIAGDNERLADREQRTIQCKGNRNGEKGGCLHMLKSMWEHSPPVPQSLHVLIALFQLLAQQFMIAQLYKNNYKEIPGDFMNTEFDSFFERARQLVTNLPHDGDALTGFRLTADELSASPVAVKVLPVLMNFRLFGISLEMINLCIALAAVTITYPSVFWRVSKGFAVIFSLHLFLNSICFVFSYLAFSVLFRMQVINQESGIRKLGLGQYMTQMRQLQHLYHPLTIIAFYVASTVLVLIAPITLYAYGYNKYFLNVLNCQSKNNMRGSSHAGQSEYSTYRGRTYRPAHSQLCCDGYGPHIAAIALLAMIVVAKAPAIYALMVMHQNDSKNFLLVCICTEVVYLFTWIILWIALTLRREWHFNVTHSAHELYALQKGLTHGHVRLNTNPSQLKNALVVVHRDNMFVTDDQNAKQSLLRAIQTNNFEVKDDSYWLKTNGGQGSPSVRRVHNESVMRVDEMNRLLSGGGTLKRQNNQDMTDDRYQAVNRSMLAGQSGQQMGSTVYRGNSSPPQGEGGFGTLQRSQQGYAVQRPGVNMSGGTMQRSLVQTGQGQWMGPAESYASIHKPKEALIYGRRGSQDDGSGFSAHSNAYSGAGQYATYARLPPQSRGTPSGSGSALRMNNSTYASHQQLGIKRPSDVTPVVAIPSVRQSPIIGDRSAAQREASPYASRATAMKLTSFNNDAKVGYGTVGWNATRPPSVPPQTHTATQQPLLWNGTKNIGTGGAISNSSSAQDNAGCFTPNSTLTSQGSNYSSAQRTPTRGSPLHSASFTKGALAEEEEFGDGTLQRAPPKPAIVTGSTSVRHTVKVIGTSARSNDDSAIASPTGSGLNDFATSVV